MKMQKLRAYPYCSIGDNLQNIACMGSHGLATQLCKESWKQIMKHQLQSLMITFHGILHYLV